MWHGLFRADACVHGRVDVSSGCVCTRPRGRYGRTRVYTVACTFRSYVRVYASGVHGYVDVLDGRSCVLNFMDDWVIFYRIIRLHATKRKAMQLKVKGM